MPALTAAVKLLRVPYMRTSSGLKSCILHMLIGGKEYEGEQNLVHGALRGIQIAVSFRGSRSRIRSSFSLVNL